MKYITQEQIDQFVNNREMKALATENGTFDMGIIEGANSDAVSEINGYLRGVYDLPLAEPVDGLLTTLCGDIMKFRMYKRRDEKAMPDNVITMYKMAVGKLKDIQNRSVVLDVTDADSGETEAANLESIQYHTPTQKFKSHFTGFDDL